MTSIGRNDACLSSVSLALSGWKAVRWCWKLSIANAWLPARPAASYRAVPGRVLPPLGRQPTAYFGRPHCDVGRIRRLLGG